MLNKLHRRQRRAWQDERSVAGSAGGGGGSSGGALPCSCCAYCDSMPWLRPLTAGGMLARQSESPLQLPCGIALWRSLALTGVPRRLSNSCSVCGKAGRRSARRQAAVLVCSGGLGEACWAVQQRRTKLTCMDVTCNCDGPPKCSPRRSMQRHARPPLRVSGGGLSMPIRFQHIPEFTKDAAKGTGCTIRRARSPARSPGAFDMPGGTGTPRSQRQRLVSRSSKARPVPYHPAASPTAAAPSAAATWELLTAVLTLPVCSGR